MWLVRIQENSYIYIINSNFLENIAHSIERSQLVAYTTFWEFPEHVDAYVHLGFLLLSEELNLTKLK